MARPKGSTNKLKNASDAQMLHKSTTRTRPNSLVYLNKDIEKVNKMLSSFEPQSLSEEIKMPVKEQEEPKKLSFQSLSDVLKSMKEKMERELTPEEKIASLKNEIERLHEAIEKFNTVIEYLETKLGIDV